MLSVASFFGQIMHRLKQPAVFGELLGGILLGPTLCGYIFPEIYHFIFSSSKVVSMGRDAVIQIQMILASIALE